MGELSPIWDQQEQVSAPKMVNQITIAGLIQGLAEGLHFAERAGLDPEKVIEVISQVQPNPGRWKIAQTMIKGNIITASAADLCEKI